MLQRLFPSFHVLACLIFAISTPSAFAQDNAADSDDVTLNPVDIIAPEPPPEPNTPTAFVSDFTITEYIDLGETLADILSLAPGLSVRLQGGPLQAQQVQIRGASAQQVLVTLDGIRLNNLFGGGFDLALLPTVAFDSAQVLRGAGGLAFGSGAEGGVVNLSLLDARDDEPSVTLRAGGGSFATLRGEGVVQGALSKTFRVSTGVSIQRTDGRFDFVDGQGDPGTRINNDATQSSGFLSTLLGREGGAQVRTISFASATERGAPGPSEFQSDFAAARSRNLLAVNALRFNMPVAYYNDDVVLGFDAQLSHRFAQVGYHNPDALLGDQTFRSRYDEHSIATQLTTTLDIGEWSTSRLLLDLRHERLQTASTQVGNDINTDRTIMAATLMQEVQPFGDFLRVFGGARVESALDQPAALVPKVGITVTPFPWLAVQANAARTYRLPSFDELYLETEFLRGDPNLRPEITWQYDAGLTLRAGRWGQLEIVAFLIEQEDLLLFVPVSSFFYQASNLAGAQSLGVENALTLTPLSWLELFAAYTYTDARFDAPPRDPLPGRPRHQFDGRLSLGDDTLQGIISTQYVGQRFLDAFGNRPEPGRFWLNLGLRWAVTEAWLLSARATNLLDVRNAVDALQQPLPGIALQGFVTWRPL